MKWRSNSTVPFMMPTEVPLAPRILSLDEQNRYEIRLLPENAELSAGTAPVPVQLHRGGSGLRQPQNGQEREGCNCAQNKEKLKEEYDHNPYAKRHDSGLLTVVANGDPKVIQLIEREPLPFLRTSGASKLRYVFKYVAHGVRSFFHIL